MRDVGHAIRHKKIPALKEYAVQLGRHTIFIIVNN